MERAWIPALGRGRRHLHLCHTALPLGAGVTRRRPARGSRARVTGPGLAAARGPQVHSGSLTVLGRTELISSAVSRTSRQLPVASSLGQTLSLLCGSGHRAHPPPRGPDSEQLVSKRRRTWANRPDRHGAQLPSQRRLPDHLTERKSKRNRTRPLREAPVRLAAGRHSGPVSGLPAPRPPLPPQRPSVLTPPLPAPRTSPALPIGPWCSLPQWSLLQTPGPGAPLHPRSLSPCSRGAPQGLDTDEEDWLLAIHGHCPSRLWPEGLWPGCG